MRSRAIASMACLLGISGVVMAACAAFSGSDAPGGPAPADAAVEEASTDASDGGTVPIEAAAGCRAAEGGFCDTLEGGTFCADFDNSQCPFLGFTGMAKGAYTFELDTTHHQSSPSSLHITQSSTAPQTGAWGPTVSLPIPQRSNRFTLQIDLDYRVPALPPKSATNAQRLAPIHLDTTNGPSVDFYLEADKSYFAFGPKADYSNDGPASKILTWHSISMIFTVDPEITKCLFSGTLDGVGLSQQQALAAPLRGGQTLTMTVGYGPYELTAGETYIDNVVVRITP